MKRFLLLALLPLTAHAVDFEASVGMAQYQVRGNGMWYQEGFPYKLSLTAPAFQVGLVGAITDNLDWHADYVWLGQVRSDATATTDENYGGPQQPCKGPCQTKTRFVGHGNVQGLKLSLEPYIKSYGWRLGVEVGAFVFKPSWNVDITERLIENNYQDGIRGTMKTNAAWQVSPMAGVSIGRGPIDLSYQFFMTKSLGKDQFTLYSATHVVQVRYRW